MKYNLSAIEVMNLLGYVAPIKQVELEAFEQENGIKLPNILREFICLAAGNPLLATADVWSETPCFYSEMIEDEDEVLEETIEEYLLIGSDYAAGVVVFGIQIADLDKENPSVYMHHEENEITEWDCLFDSVSEYLMAVLCDVISCAEYDTAKKVLKELGWNYTEYKDSEIIWEQLKKQEINLENAIKYKSIYGMNAEVYCCYAEGANQLFVVRKEGQKLEMCILTGQVTV